MFCSKCGTELDGEFCYNCGAKSARYLQYINSTQNTKFIDTKSEVSLTCPSTNNDKPTIEIRQLDFSTQPEFYSGRCLLCGKRSDSLNMKSTCPECQVYVDNINQIEIPDINENERKRKITRDLIVGGMIGFITVISAVLAQVLLKIYVPAYERDQFFLSPGVIVLVGIVVYVIYLMIRIVVGKK